MKGGKQGLRIMGLRFKVEGLRFACIFLFSSFFYFSALSQADSAQNLFQNKNTHLIHVGIPAIKKDDFKIMSTIGLSTLLESEITSVKNQTTLNYTTPNYITSNPPTLQPKETKKRIRLMTLANVAGYSLATYGFYNAWYKNQPTTSFHFFNDNAEWLQVDKAGHVYGAYIGSRASMELWRWTGISRNKRIWLGGLSGLAFQTIIETFDGFGKDWGWSWGDVGANAFGCGLLMGQEFLWNEQRIDVKFSFHRRNYNEPMLSERADSLYGTSILNRMVKDYNGQTYWLSANIKSFFPKANVPSWLNIAVGYGAEGMFEGRKNIWKDRNGNMIDRTDINRYRQWYIAPDINLTKIKTKSKVLKTVLFFFNSFKFPLPSIGFSKKGVEWNWIHF